MLTQPEKNWIYAQRYLGKKNNMIGKVFDGLLIGIYEAGEDPRQWQKVLSSHPFRWRARRMAKAFRPAVFFAETAHGIDPGVLAAYSEYFDP